MRIRAAGSEAEIKVTPVDNAKQVSDIIDKFRAKYSPGDVKKYCSKFDVAVVARVE